jgi:multidrug efflux pump subunit AcrA (membrane-fusion protein)
MKIKVVIVITLVVLGTLIPTIGCTSEEAEADSIINEIYTAQRGDLTVDITAVGNLALSETENLSFDIAGTVEDIFIEEGDTVTEGELLARLDPLELEDYLTELENKLASREQDLLQAEINVINAEIALENAQDIYQWPEILDAELAIDDAERVLDYAQFNLERATIEEEVIYWENVVEGAQAVLEIAESRLEAIHAGYDMDEVTVKRLQLEMAQTRLDDAHKELAESQDELNEALEASPEIRAPFDGFIIKLNVAGGDEVAKGTVALIIADPNKFEADIMVGELDIIQVQNGSKAWVQVDALSGLTLPAEVAHISPTATISQGVVNYGVTVEITSLESVLQERRATQQGGMLDVTPEEIAERLQQAVEAGRMTQEQAQQMLEAIQQGQISQLGQGSQSGQLTTMIPEEFQLREGLTVTVNIIVDESSDVLLVPNAAVTTTAGQASVQVVLSDGTSEERIIQTGISDWQFTEVTDGLNEGEQVLVPQGTATTTTTQQNQPGGFFMPGMGRR